MKCIRRIIKTIFIISEKLPAIGKIVKNIRINILNNYRIWLVQQSEDNIFIPRVENAGSIVGNYQIMHNGIKILKDGYYGDWVTRMFCQNRGVHEPQEERVFQDVLSHIESGSVMIELGSYWGFYSMWFYKKVKNAKCYLVEPDKNNLDIGKKNFQTNNCEGVFINAAIGSNKYFPEVPLDTVDNLIDTYHIDKISIIHSDIQHSEYEMLRGAERALKNKSIDYLFISTHSNILHNKCKNILRSYGYKISVDVNMNESYSYDGLIVACRDSDIFCELQVSKSNNTAEISYWDNFSINKNQYIYYFRNILKYFRIFNNRLFEKLLKYKKENSVIYDPLINMYYSPDTAIGKKLFYEGLFEDTEISTAESLIKNNDPVILDIGSNIGYNAIRWAKYFKQGIVYCIEPSNESIEILKKNIAVNNMNNIYINNVELSYYSGESIFHSCIDNAFSSLLDTKRSPIQKEYTVQVDTIDGQMDKLSIKRLDFIKIDTEGSEEKVLMGGMETIEKYKPVIMVEISKRNPDINEDSIFNLLIRKGYKAYACIDDIGAEEYKEYNEKYENYFFIPIT